MKPCKLYVIEYLNMHKLKDYNIIIKQEIPLSQLV